MNTHCGIDNLKDLYAIKHALKKQINWKKTKIKKLKKITNIPGTCQYECIATQVKVLKRDMFYEMSLVRKINDKIHQIRRSNGK